MKLIDISKGYLVPFLEQARKESALYEGLIVSHTPDVLAPAIQKIVGRKSIQFLAFRGSGCQLLLRQPFSATTVDQVLQRMEVGGWFLAGISVVVDDEDYNYKDVKQAFLHIQRLNQPGTQLFLLFEAKYGINVIKYVLKQFTHVYHVTPTLKVNKILKFGLSPKAGSKIANHPDRVYFAFTDYEAMHLAAQMSAINKQTEYTILKIDTQAFNRPGVNLF